MSQIETPTADFEDPRTPLRQALKFGVMGWVAVTVVSLVLWGWLYELPGIWGVVIGAAIGGGYVLLTVLSVLSTANTSPNTTAAVILGGWLIKVVLVLIILMVLRGMGFFHQWAMLVTLILSLLIVLVAETWGVLTSRALYVS
ncbi:hypothetical protein GP475_04890 [Corynebacterium poyangense]|uniref:Uncharacterized protein n=1 Tax=Corynebacterium poyangense TaxID=2684405 RepID=A0A7H0SS85_9CORY|nr:hypothetical protein [Corynebacterium poyangense]MBZ8177079.1 hypothetical protein [Corynebacterium poyangense]QNQ91410.1 hypothetical protein GP475_04890 [Corynebacterium poyangense]